MNDEQSENDCSPATITGMRSQFEAGFSKLASDPKKLGHTPVLPYAWKGPLWDFKVREQDGWFNVTVFFLFDDDPDIKRIYVHELNIIRPYWGEKEKGSPKRSAPASEPEDVMYLPPPKQSQGE